MRLDASYLHFISKEYMRVLSAIEVGMRNHYYVSLYLITRIANLRNGETFKIVRKLLKNKFIVHIGNKCNGYKLTYLGYDYLALQTFIKRGILKDVLIKIGVGKYSDIYKCTTPDGEHVVLKLTRLGRNSFRSIKKNRYYIQHRTNYNWFYLSRLSATRYFLFMQLLSQNGFSTPRPIDTNRHAIVMSLVDGYPLCHIQRISTQRDIQKLFYLSLEMLVKFAKHGLIHGDYNYFNLLVNEAGNKLTVIDFPQCVSINHPNARTYFDRDVQCIYTYFDKMAHKSHDDSTDGKILDVSEYPLPNIDDIVVEKRLDHYIKQLGHITLKESNDLEKWKSEEESMRAEIGEDQYEYQEGSEFDVYENGDNYEDTEENQTEENPAEDNRMENNRMEQNRTEYNRRESYFCSYQTVNDQCNEYGYLYKKLVEVFEGIYADGDIAAEQINNVPIPKGSYKYDTELSQLIDSLSCQYYTQKGYDGKQVAEYDNYDEYLSTENQQLSHYELRIKLKEAKRLYREKKKASMSEYQFIKNALRKHHRPVEHTRGNHGNKIRNKQSKMDIRDGMY